MVLIVLIAAMMSCGAFLTVAFYEYNQAAREVRHSQALFLAQAGLQRAMSDAGAASSLSNLTGMPYQNVALGPGTYTVEIDSASGGGVVIRSTGTVQDRSRTIQLRLSRN